MSNSLKLQYSVSLKSWPFWLYGHKKDSKKPEKHEDTVAGQEEKKLE
jgi:hypothetical protein